MRERDVRGLCRAILIFFALLFALSPLEAFAEIEQQKQNSTQRNDLEKLVLQLRWNHQFQFAGYYVADWNGYFEEEGLDVEIRSAFTEDEVILNATDEVRAGRADFGIGAADVLLAENDRNDMTIVASVFQRSAVEYYMKTTTPFYSIFDFTKLNTARRKNDLLDVELQAMFISEGIKPDNSKMITYSYDFTENDLITNRFDVIPGYLGTIPYLAGKRNLALRVIKPIDYGIDFYGDSLFTKKSMAEGNPELVEKFRRACIKGWEYALTHQNEVAARIASEFKIEGKSEKELREFNTYQAKKVTELTLYPIVQIGNINTHRWETMQDILVQLGLAKGNPNFSEFIFNYESIKTKKQETISKVIIFSSLIGLVGFIGVMLVHLAAKNRMLRLEIAERQRVEEENQRKEALLIYQARQAAMGEMIGNIAHQWRQPLNNLGLIVSNLEDSSIHNELDTEQVVNSVAKCRKLIANMSTTIDDFRYFLNPSTEKALFSVSKSIETVLELLEENMRFNGIQLQYDLVKDGLVYGYGNQLSQAIFNIISNSIDGLVEKGTGDRSIQVKIEKESREIHITIQDNGVGIPADVADRIFDVYFSTKSAQKGTGLGLYMSKLIIEHNLKGKIHLANHINGVTMFIALPEGGNDV